MFTLHCFFFFLQKAQQPFPMLTIPKLAVFPQIYPPSASPQKCLSQEGHCQFSQYPSCLFQIISQFSFFPQTNDIKIGFNIALYSRVHQNHLEGLLKQTGGSRPHSSDSEGLGCGPEICTAEKFLPDNDGAAPGTILYRGFQI